MVEQVNASIVNFSLQYYTSLSDYEVFLKGLS